MESGMKISMQNGASMGEVIEQQRKHIERLEDNLLRARREYRALQQSSFTISKVIKRGVQYDENLQIIETFPTEGGVVIYVA